MLFILFVVSSFYSQNATEIIKKSNDNVNGLSSKSISKMTIVRPDWTREVEMKTWSKGGLIVLLGRDYTTPHSKYISVSVLT